MLSAAALLLGVVMPFSTANNVLSSGDTMNTGQSLTRGAYTFTMQSVCNLVLYDNGRAVWSSGTYNRGHNCILHLQTDDDLVIYSSGRAVWASQTSGPQG
ncbi:hypothetical protein ZIOFF_063137 [Zingiber officinale]|uniref:Bulb-type lectin domain-containing protein n=1 Tax=Zingiber officinale TaxID=94328 RepID=A0A8J5KFZ3_ZINOF|nr:hypothetical protein ZIOFF_063137 [Zingiber officinale]